MPSYLPTDSLPASSPTCTANAGTTGLVITWLLLGIGIIVVFLRIYLRLNRHATWWDDWTALASLLMGIVSGGFFTKMIASGMGRHVDCLDPESVVAMLEFSAISEALNVIGIGIVKIAVCLALLRVVDRARRKMAIFLWGLLVFVALTHSVLAMIFFLHCRPLAALWNPEVKGSCLSTNTAVLAGYIGFAIDVVTDLVCAIIPVVVIRQLQMNLRTKVALCGLMGLGVFTAGCAVAKAVALRGVFADDYAWGFTAPATWAAVEQFVGIIIASVPSLRPLFAGLLEKSRRAGSRSYSFNFWRRTGSTSKESNEQRRTFQIFEVRQPPMVKRKRDTLLDSCDRDHRIPSAALSNQTTMYEGGDLDEPQSQRPIRQFDVEDGIADSGLGQDGNMNFLHDWALPVVADRRSAMFSLPYLGSIRSSKRWSFPVRDASMEEDQG